MAQGKILIVEDDWHVAEDMKDKLTEFGYVVSGVVPSGEEAIKKVEQTSTDLVLMDIVLKGEMDGVETADQIRALCDIPVVYVTAHADDELLERAKITQPYGYITKPYQDKELHTAIEIALYRHKAEKTLKKAHEELKVQSRHLEDVNAALRVLLKQREEDKEDFKENILSNMKQMVIPHLEKLRKNGLDERQLALVDTVESNLNSIVSPFINKLSSGFLNLTPTEIRVADFVKEGKTNKEIAELLDNSPNTIRFHRYNLRNKLGLQNKKRNLRSYLLSLTK